MVTLPKEVAERLERLRGEHSHYVTVKVIRGKYYAFEVTGKWDKNLKKNKTITAYLGRIRENGEFTPVSHRNTVDVEVKRAEFQSEKSIDEQDRTVLRNLSMNAQMPISELAKKLRLSPSATRYVVERAEKKYAIKYFVEIDTELLGYRNYITLVHFIDKVPAISFIKEALKNEFSIQIAFTTKGKYDLIFFSLARISRDIALLVSRLLSGAFKSYEARWYTSPYYSAYDFIPPRSEFFDLLLKDKRVWKKGKDRETQEWIKKSSDQLTGAEFYLLKELSRNGAVTFADVERDYSLAKGMAQYAFHKLTDRGIIKRITITMESLPIKYNALISATIINGEEFAKTRANFLFDVIRETEGPINRYVAIGDIEVPKSILFIMPVFKDGDLEDAEDNFKRKVKGINLKSLIITNVILGRLCYRRLDNDYSRHYSALVEEEKALHIKVKEKY